MTPCHGAIPQPSGSEIAMIIAGKDPMSCCWACDRSLGDERIQSRGESSVLNYTAMAAMGLGSPEKQDA